jgi:hypothetical protein
MGQQKVPNLFVIGAMKCGTSSLHSYLGTHPEIFMCRPKEPCFFVPREQLNWPEIDAYGFWRGEEVYLRLFECAQDAKYRGESSTLYSKAPKICGIAEKLYRFNPHARLIYIMRDPVQRTVSHYWHEVRRQREQREIDSALREDQNYLHVSNYAMQLREYLRYFDPTQIFALTLEELKSDPLLAMRSIFNWLDVDVCFEPTNLHIQHNATREMVHQIKGRGWLHSLRHSRLWNSIGPWMPLQLRSIGVHLAERRFMPKAVDLSGILPYLRTIQRPQTEELETLLERSFPEWHILHGCDESRCNDGQGRNRSGVIHEKCIEV